MRPPYFFADLLTASATTSKAPLGMRASGALHFLAVIAISAVFSGCSHTTVRCAKGNFTFGSGYSSYTADGKEGCYVEVSRRGVIRESEAKAIRAVLNAASSHPLPVEAPTLSQDKK